MKFRIVRAALAALLCVRQWPVAAATPDEHLRAEVARSVTTYTPLTVFDDVHAQVESGVVTLSGKVTMPMKKEDLGKRVAAVNRGDVPCATRSRCLPPLRWRRRAAAPDCTGDLRQRRLLAIRRDADAADPHTRGMRPRDAHRHRCHGKRSHACPLAGDRSWRDLVIVRAEDRALAACPHAGSGRSNAPRRMNHQTSKMIRITLR